MTFSFLYQDFNYRKYTLFLSVLAFASDEQISCASGTMILADSSYFLLQKKYLSFDYDIFIFSFYFSSIQIDKNQTQFFG